MTITPSSKFSVGCLYVVLSLLVTVNSAIAQSTHTEPNTSTPHTSCSDDCPFDGELADGGGGSDGSQCRYGSPPCKP
ncbi:MAG: hypothetical protein QNJ72_17135 [Pleurocapsa sp. MO_226.B13]|nr:hypothetical protein [Pleurocapsa sp. MO_226.B13]